MDRKVLKIMTTKLLKHPKINKKLYDLVRTVAGAENGPQELPKSLMSMSQSQTKLRARKNSVKVDLSWQFVDAIFTSGNSTLGAPTDQTAVTCHLHCLSMDEQVLSPPNFLRYQPLSLFTSTFDRRNIIDYTSEF